MSAAENSSDHIHYLPAALRGRLTSGEALREFAMSPATLSRWSRKLGVAPVRFGRHTYWRRDDLEKIEAARMRGAEIDAAKAQADEAAAAELAALEKEQAAIAAKVAEKRATISGRPENML